jgi:tetratricopeptide (TPR) repeat protein
MKTLKPTRRHVVGRAGKSAAGVASVAGRARGTSQSKIQSRQREAIHRVAGARSRNGHQGAKIPASGLQPGDSQHQAAVRSFEVGLRAFHRQNYDKAAVIFAKLVGSEARDVAERAHVHLRLCRQKTAKPGAAPRSAEDYYALGVACLNSRQYRLAIEHLSKANRLKSRQDHVHYALAVSHALEGNPDAAFAHLEEAFTLHPENRIHARRDEDLQGLAGDPRFRRLMHPAGS